MEEKVQKQIIDYFSFFEEFHNSSKTCLKDCQKCAIAINKLIVRCRKIKRADLSGSALADFDGIQCKLLASIHNLISEEIDDIKNNLSNLEELFEKLCIKKRQLSESCRELNWDEPSTLIKGSPYQPPLLELLEFSEDTVTFGGELCAKINTSLQALSLKGLNSDSQVENFKVGSTWQNRLPEILLYTSFCSENQL